MTPDFQVDPELEGILREVAADPRATLLRVARPAAFRAAIESSTAVSANATGLLSAERQLLRVHRAELANLFRRACLTRLFTDPEAKKQTVRQVSATRRHEFPDEATVAAECRRELSRTLPPESRATGIESLLRAVASHGLHTVGVDQLAAASLRLAPSDEARLYAACYRAMHGGARESLEVFVQIAERRTPAALASSAWANIGRALEELGDKALAPAAYRSAYQLDSSRVLPPLSWFGCALIAGDTHAAREAASHVDERFMVTDTGVREFIAMNQCRGRPPTESVTITRTLRSIESTLGRTTEVVGYALA